MKKSFLKSKSIGDEGEKIVIDILGSSNILAERKDGRKKDIFLYMGDKTFSGEVKYDRMSESTGNIALEFFNSKSLKPSGFMSSECDFWFHVLNRDSVWVTSPASIKAFVNNKKPLKIIKSGGDNNADLMLYKKEDIELFAKKLAKEEDIKLCLMYYLK